ncbi:putative metalloprotease CJM1_0395 family protein [Sulfurospirillum arcachonense]|uniref:putative metalloprotease CJM1_0395 family protein n=1 Tax=Sulfurospirillum arcachonense TaxID=57666 RepID=UPI00046A2191|nr:putative metalloprotease CJM1_0395 family protein [Sulfurospirillum arcachonense]
MKVGGFLNSSLTRVSNPYEQTVVQKTADETKETNKQEELTTSQKSLIARLQATDQAVRKHEAAHIAAGGGVIRSGANFIYQEGPDKKQYAVGGEVSIDTSTEATPEETIPKMQLIKTAALAPSDPSSTDYQVASTATMLEMQARLELSLQLKEELANKNVSQYANNENSESKFSIYA